MNHSTSGSTGPALLIMAAGMGSRYGGLKQIDGVSDHGETLLEYSVFDALRAGFGKLVIVIQPSFEATFRERFGRVFERRVEVAYAFQQLDRLPEGLCAPPARRKPWGTGHAILAAESAIDRPFAVINADDFYGRGAFQLIHDWLAAANPAETHYAMAGYRLGQTLSPHGHVARAICNLDDTGHLRGISERTGIGAQGGRITDQTDGTPFTGQEPVSMNLWGFTPPFFGQLNDLFREFLARHIHDEKAEFYIATAIQALIDRGQARVRVLPTDEAWFGMTYRDDAPAVAARVGRLIDAGVYPAPLWGERP